MTNLTRFDPFQNLGKYDPFNGMREMFDAFMSPSWMPNIGPAALRLDVREDAESYLVHADIPGFRKEDIHIEIDGDTVTIGAETQQTQEQKQGDNYLFRERHAGKVMRSFTLNHHIEEAGVQARYADGVLEIFLPKKNGGQAKHISVQ